MSSGRGRPPLAQSSCRCTYGGFKWAAEPLSCVLPRTPDAISHIQLPLARTGMMVEGVKNEKWKRRRKWRGGKIFLVFHMKRSKYNVKWKHKEKVFLDLFPLKGYKIWSEISGNFFSIMHILYKILILYLLFSLFYTQYPNDTLNLLQVLNFSRSLLRSFSTLSPPVANKTGLTLNLSVGGLTADDADIREKTSHGVK